MGSPIRVSYVLMDNATLNHLGDYRNINTDQFTKATYGIISYLLELLNASKVHIWANTWGYVNKTTKKFNGMYGDLMYDRADLAGTAGLIQIERQEHFKIIPPINPTAALFIFQAPPLSYTSNIFTLVFSKMVWTTFLSLMIFSAVLIYLVLIFEWERHNKVNKKTCKPNISHVLFLECVVIAQRGTTWEINSIAGKIVLLFTFLLCSHMYTGFSAAILVLLQSTSEKITDLPGLYDSKMEMGAENMSFNVYYFTTPNEHTNETLRRLILENRIVPKNNWFSTKDGLEKVRQGYFAFHVQTGVAFSLIRDTFTEDDKCRIRTTPTIFKSSEISLATPKNSVYTEMFLVGFRRIMETGLQNREHKKIYARKPHCTGTHRHYDSIGLMDCYFPFLIFGLGLVASCLILVCEILHIEL